MNKNKAVIIFLTMISMVSCKSRFDFENVSWGATKNQVIRKIGIPKDVEPHILVYQYKYDSSDVMKGYMFYGEKLASVTKIYHFENLPEEKSTIIFLKKSDSLVKKFGSTTDSILDENGSMVRKWQTKRSNVLLYYRKTSVMLAVESKDLAPYLQYQMDETHPKEEE